MAIQFNCPYCTATIRVPDSAGGKRGSCPKCQTQLIVPQVAPPLAATPATPPPAPQPPGSAGPPPKVTPPPPPPVSLAGDGIPVIQTEPQRPAGVPSMARAVRQRARRKGLNPLVPIVLFSVVVGVVLFVMREENTKLEGQLRAVALTEYVIPPGMVDLSALDLPAEEVETALTEMQTHRPAGVRIPEWLELQFRAEPEGLNVLIRETSATEVFRVSTQTEAGLREFLNEHQEEIGSRQLSERREALQRFFKEWQFSQETDALFETASYRNSLGLNSMTGPLGYCVEADAGGRAFRCVYEDQGELYFLLPRGTTQFELRGREMEDGSTVFPGHYTVEVKETISTPAPTPEPEPEPESKNPSEINPSTGQDQAR